MYSLYFRSIKQPSGVISAVELAPLTPSSAGLNADSHCHMVFSGGSAYSATTGIRYYATVRAPQDVTIS